MARERRNRNREEVTEEVTEEVNTGNVLQDLFAQAMVSEPSTGDFENLPDGDYEVVLSSLEYKNNKKGNPMITYVLTVIDDNEFNGRKHWKHVNLVHGQTGEFQPGVLRAEMEFIYELVGSTITSKSDLNEFMDIIDEVNEAATSDDPIVLDMNLKASKTKAGNLWVTCKLA